MQCPRCGNQWDVSKSPCSLCGLLVHLPNRSRETTQSPVTPFPQTSPAADSRITPTDSLMKPPTTGEPAKTSSSSFPSQSMITLPLATASVLRPGTLLRSERYRLQKIMRHQEWLPGSSETMWLAQDALRSGAEVMVCEVILPGGGSLNTQSVLRTSTIALTSIGRDSRIPTLWDAFSERGQTFFVFEPVAGEALLTLMHRQGRPLPESEVVECCLQIAEILELLAQQSPPLVHGLIRPEHILVTRARARYVLTNFSVVLAAGATQFIAGVERTRLSPYAAPEFSRGMIDTRADLYALLATAHHMVTGSGVMRVDGTGKLPHARSLNPNVSPQFASILEKGLHPLISQRYQHPAALRQELLTIRSMRSDPTSKGKPSPHERRFEQTGRIQVPRSVLETPPPSSQNEAALKTATTGEAPSHDELNEVPLLLMEPINWFRVVLWAIGIAFVALVLLWLLRDILV